MVSPSLNEAVCILGRYGIPYTMGGRQRKEECLVGTRCLPTPSPAQTLKPLCFIPAGFVSKSEVRFVRCKITPPPTPDKREAAPNLGLQILRNSRRKARGFPKTGA